MVSAQIVVVQDLFWACPCEEWQNKEARRLNGSGLASEGVLNHEFGKAHADIARFFVDQSCRYKLFWLTG